MLQTRLQHTLSQSGERPALVYDDQTINYQSLSALVDRCVANMQSQGVVCGDVVCIVNHKTPLGYALILACLKIGAVFCHVDKQNPQARCEKMFAQAKPNWLVSDGQLPGHIILAAHTQGARCLSLSESENAVTTVPPINDDGLAYIMFTSGSTGAPKAVGVGRASVLRFADWIASRFSITENDVISQLNPLYFDNSIFDLFAAFTQGAALVPITPEQLLNPKTTLQTLQQAKTSVWFSVPSLLVYYQSLRAIDTIHIPTLKHIIFGGEAYPKSMCHALFNAYAEHAQLVNVYGPTEGTCICSSYTVSESDFENDDPILPLGTLNPGFDYRISEGELWLGGANLAKGYIGQPDLTAERFVTDTNGERFYRTGDRVRMDNGLLTFHGRTDNMIKHQGYRISLEEIAYAISQYEGVEQAVVHYQNGRLIAHLQSSRSYTTEQVRTHLSDHLPHYMLVDEVICHQQLPKNANGKVTVDSL